MAMKSTIDQLDRIATYAEEFLQTVKNRLFRNPDTDNEVKFVSLPAPEQRKVYEQWAASRERRPDKDDEEARGRGGPPRTVGEWTDVGVAPVGTIVRDEDSGDEYEILETRYEKATARNVSTGKKKILHDTGNNILVRLPEKAKEASLKMEEELDAPYRKAGSTRRWADMSGPERAARRNAFGEVMVEEEEVVLPADVRRMSAERMRELGRSLMVAGMRAPRQQMISIAVTFDGLLAQLEMLGQQDAGLGALRRRILLGLRGKVLGR